MATQFINKAILSTVIGESPIEFDSNEVTAELIDDTSVTLLKTQSEDIVVTGSVVTYTIVITNNAPEALADVDFSDVIPTGLTFNEGSFTVNGTTQTPTIVEQNLSYEIASLEIGNTTIEFTVTVD